MRTTEERSICDLTRTCYFGGMSIWKRRPSVKIIKDIKEIRASKRRFPLDKQMYVSYNLNKEKQIQINTS
jgi:hypothetical protein